MGCWVKKEKIMLATVELESEMDRENTRESQLARLVQDLLSRVPLYQGEGYPEASALEVAPSSKLFHQLPIILKTDLRKGFPQNFLGPDGDLDSLVADGLAELEFTSGTSEERTPLILRKGWWLEQEERALRLNPFVASVLDQNPNAHRITINSPTCNNDISYITVPDRDERIVGTALSLSLSRHPFLWSAEELGRMVSEALEWNPVFMDLDPVYGVIFALYCERQGVRFPDLKFILCSYEFVSSAHRRILERVFKVPVLVLYGATETGHLLMENEKSLMVPSQETAYLELVNPDERHIGRLLATTFTNEYMPLLRYQLGDLASMTRTAHGVNYVIHGREKDCLRSPYGHRITAHDVDECFRGLEGIAHYQLTQLDEANFLLRYVPETEAPSDDALDLLKARLAAVLGTSEDKGLRIELTDLVLPEGSGKFRLLVPRK